MTGVVDVTLDSGSEVAEVVDISDAEGDDGEGGVSEISTGGEPPTLFRGYRRGQELGRGASGKVFVCSRKQSATGFAVKIVDLRRIELSSNAEREQKKLRREVDILKKLPPHKSVVQLVDAFEEGHWMFFVLELVGGGDLFTVLTARTTPRLLDREAAFVLRQLVGGLQFLHAQGVIHRDLKLENVLVASERRLRPVVLYTVKITDFGLSKTVGAGLSEARSTVGTRPYTAPEVLREGVHDFSSDLWCLGVLLFVLVAGHFPFDHIASQQSELDAIVDRIKATEPAKNVLKSFLRLEPAQRLSLAVLEKDEWLLDDTSLTRPQKRQRTFTNDRSASASLSPLIKPEATDLSQVPELGCFRSRSSGDNPTDESSTTAAAEPPPQSAPSPKSMHAKALAAEQAEIEQNFAEDQKRRRVEANADVASDQVMPMSAASKADEKNAHNDAAQTGFGEADIGGLRIPKGAWTPFTVEAPTVRINDVQPPSTQPEIMQAHVVILDSFAGSVLGPGGSRIQTTAATAGCKVWMTSRSSPASAGDRRVIIIGTYKQCKIAQELVHEQIANALKKDWRDQEAEVLLFVRIEAAGVVTGKQGYVLDNIRKHSGARIQLLRQEVENQRPCIIAGTLQNVLRAQRLVFHLVSCVPVTRFSAETGPRTVPPAAQSAGGTPDAADAAEGAAADHLAADVAR